MSDPVPIFSGIKKNGKAKILHRELTRFSKFWWTIPDGTFIDIIYRKHEDLIDDPLRKYYFKVVAKMIADESQMDKDMVHENMKFKFASEPHEKSGMLIIKSVFSNESKMPVSEKEEFVERVRSWAMDFFGHPEDGIVFYIPKKGEAYY